MIAKVKMQNSAKRALLAVCCPMVSWSEPRQISGLRGAAHSVSVPCCPIEVGEFKKSEAIPNDASNDGEEAGEAVRPLALEGNEAEQDVKEQGRPELPADGMGVKSWEKTMCFAWGIARFDVAVQGRLTWGSCND